MCWPKTIPALARPTARPLLPAGRLAEVLATAAASNLTHVEAHEQLAGVIQQVSKKRLGGDGLIIKSLG